MTNFEPISGLILLANDSTPSIIITYMNNAQNSHSQKAFSIEISL